MDKHAAAKKGVQVQNVKKPAEAGLNQRISRNAQ